MKPGDLCMTWHSQLSAEGSSSTVRAIGEVLSSSGSNAASAIRALELLLVTLDSTQLTALREAIRDDARERRRASGGGSAERVRLTALSRKKSELEERLASLTKGSPADAETQRRIESRTSDELMLRETVARMANELQRLGSLRQLLDQD